MEPIQKVRQISQKEAREIDANNVDFFTLTDGTIVRIKGEGETSYGSGTQIKGGEPILTQINEIEEGINNQNKKNFVPQNKEIQTTIEESKKVNQQEQNILSKQYQSKVQIQNQQLSNKIEKENNVQVNTNLTSVNKAFDQNEDEILQPGDNYGYYLSNDRNNIVQTKKNQRCTCNHQLQQGAFYYYNAHLIDAEIVENKLINELELKNLSQSETQIFHQGPTKKKKLFKLIEAVPIVFTDIGKQYMNQNANAQFNLQQSNNNTYAAEKYRLQNMKQKMGMNYNTQFYQQNYGRNIPRSKTYLNKQGMIKRRRQYGQYGNKRSNINNQQGLIMQEYQSSRNWQYNNRFDNNKVQCTCPMRNLAMRKQYNLIANEFDNY